MMKSVGKAKSIRKSVLKMVYEAKAAHVGSCLSCVDILSVIYSDILRENIDSKDGGLLHKDIVLVSKGHASAAVYATLAHFGYFSEDILATYSQNGSKLAGHVTKTVPGVQLSTGALGHALSVATGMALADRERRVFVIASDGECNEGSMWEAALFAGHHGLSNLTLVVDYNKIQSFGRVSDILDMEPFADKWKAFKWSSLEVDGHCHESLNAAFNECIAEKSSPSVIIAHTVKGKGVSFMENNNQWHYTPPTDEQFKQAIEEIENA